MRILVTGSRDFADQALVHTQLAQARDTLVEMDPERFLREGCTVVSGHARTGADRFAEEWAKRQFDVNLELHPADWRQHRKKAGFIRNQEMVERGADVCLAFISPCTKPGCPYRGRHDSHGTADCVHRAEAAGIMVWRFRRTA